MSDKRRPYPGDILLNPQRWVIWTDSNTKEFGTEPLEGDPDWHYGAENLPASMQGKPFEGAPIDTDAWKEKPA